MKKSHKRKVKKNMSDTEKKADCCNKDEKKDGIDGQTVTTTTTPNPAMLTGDAEPKKDKKPDITPRTVWEKLKESTFQGAGFQFGATATNMLLKLIGRKMFKTDLLG